MAVGARDVAMRADRVLVVLWLIVAAHAVRSRDRLVAPEAVAILAGRRACATVQRRRDDGMAARADFRRRLRESGVAVTLGACELADVREVASARGDLEVARRDLLGRRGVAPTTAADRDDRDDDRRAHHGRDPIG